MIYINLNRRLQTLNSEIHSVDEYRQCIEKAKKICKDEFNQDGFDFFYRGDLFCSKVQSNFFRYGDIKEENTNFLDWQKSCPLNGKSCKCDKKGEFLCFALMQHYNDKADSRKWQNRLLDFSSDEMVALRFACGEKGKNPGCRRKVTGFFTDCIIKESDEDSKEISCLMELVNSKWDDIEKLYHNKDFNKILRRDYFVKALEDDERIKRQKGLFLFMGNFTTTELYTGLRKKHSRKHKHELSSDVGRGDKYKGFVFNITIAADSVDSIREKLECNKYYKMEYLLN